MKWIQVEQTPKLQGSIDIPGSKNSSLALLAAACLAEEPVTLLGIPNISDFQVICEMGQEIGLSIARDAEGAVHIDPSTIKHAHLDPVKSSTYRAAYYFVGALLPSHGKVALGYPGGDDFVSRPMEQHVKALQMMGAKFTFHEKYYEVEAKRLTGTSIYFDMITMGATINSMLAAVRAEGTTILHNAAKDPEVTDTANLLNQMGANIRGAGTDTIRIEGVSSLRGTTYRVIPDRLIAGAFLIGAGMFPDSSITVNDVVPEHLGSCIAKLTEIGVQIEEGDNSITAYSTGRLRATRVRTGMYPIFATDLQQPMTALLTQAAGKSIVSDKIYPHRFNHAVQMQRMGADIKLRPGVAFINGGKPLHGALVHASDIRAGICLILAGFAAEGVTAITGVHHFERGYENVVEAFASLGANIKVCESRNSASGLLLSDVQ